MAHTSSLTVDQFVFPFPEIHFQKEGKVKLARGGSKKENKSLKKEKMGNQIRKIWTETKLKSLWLNAQCKFNFIIFKVPYHFSSVQFSSVAQSCLTLCDPMNRSTPGLPVHHQLPESTQAHVH